MTADWLPAGARLPRPGDEDAARAHWARWREAGPPAGGEGGAAGALLDAVFGNSPFLSRCLVSDPAFSRLLLEEGPDAAFAAALEEASSAPADEAEDALMARLRAAKRRAALAIGVADIAGAWPLERVTGGLSDFAEASLRAACRSLLRAAGKSGRLDLPDPGDPEAGSGLVVLGMGKLGARELNYSSDIDIIVLYDEDAAPVAAGAEPGRVFVRLARRLLRIMDERTADGYVFRTDLRLRPDPASTPLALSARAAARYYREAGRTWERAAMIKVRPVAGDPRAGEAFLDVLRDFVWRRRLDFVAVQEMREIKRQIDSSRGGGGGDSVAGRNVKLGRGGIREIEFFAQAQQLAWGGRDPELRPRGTLEAIDALAAAGQVDGGAVAELRDAYDFLRGVEHRLQMVDDRQTHSLPGDEAGVAAAAVFAGFDSPGDFSTALLARLRTVGRHYDGLFAGGRPAAARAAGELALPEDADDPATLRALAELGYADPARASATARGWRAGRHSAMREERARELAAALAPAALAAFAATTAPDAALARFDALLARAGDGARLFSLLSANPGLLDLVADVMGSAPRLADLLTRHPDVLDSVLSRDFADLEAPDDLGREPGVALAARRGLVRLFYAREFGAREMKADLAEAARRAGDLQDLFDVQRRWANERQFQIGVHLLRGLLTPVEAAGPLSDIAETCLHALTPAVAEEFAARHGRVPGGRAAVVAFGKLGSREMTVGSDLDLMFVYDADPGAAQSDGRRPLAPGAYYGRLCRRLIAALTAPTAEGSPYEVDMRLRPSGAAGPIACSLAAFAAYHEKEAWTWERQALTRARVVLSTGGLGEEFERARLDVLVRPRERAALAADVAAMRERVRSERGSGGRWSVRYMRGGLLDVEFIAQFLQLLHAAEAPEVLAGDSVSVFEAAGARGLVDAGAARELAEAAALWRNLEGVIRAAVGARAEGEEAEGAIENLLARSSGKAVLGALVESMRDTAERVARRFDETVASQAA